SNSEVKPVSADDSVGCPCESRTLPDLYMSPSRVIYWGFFIASSYVSETLNLTVRYL
ncbi:MAG: hypothetical protein ACI9SP_004843, partial [Arenicella sp.]